MTRVLDHRVGEHDEASRAFRITLLAPVVPTTAKFWVPGRTPLNQGDTGHCGGFGAAAEAAASPLRWKTDDAWAHTYYYEIKRRRLDPWGLEDGTSSLAVMKLGALRGLWNSYYWCLDSQGLADVKRGLSIGPVTIGVPWMTGMFNPNSDGIIRATGQDEGGHFTLLTGWTPKYKRYGEAYRIRNSWGTWGLNGSAYIPADDLFDILVRRGGEGAVPTERKMQHE